MLNDTKHRSSTKLDDFTYTIHESFRFINIQVSTFSVSVQTLLNFYTILFTIKQKSSLKIDGFSLNFTIDELYASL